MGLVPKKSCFTKQRVKGGTLTRSFNTTKWYKKSSLALNLNLSYFFDLSNFDGIVKEFVFDNKRIGAIFISIDIGD